MTPEISTLFIKTLRVFNSRRNEFLRSRNVEWAHVRISTRITPPWSGVAEYELLSVGLRVSPFEVATSSKKSAGNVAVRPLSTLPARRASNDAGEDCNYGNANV